MTIKIVTDSTCDLPANIIRKLGITVVPLYINVGDKGYLDGVEITRKDFYTRLPDYDEHPTTGTPGKNAFSQAYTKLASEGATQILSIHISKSLSATIEVAEITVKDFDKVPVIAKDSLQLSFGTGFQVETAARMAKQGKTVTTLSPKDDSFSRHARPNGPRSVLTAQSERVERFLANILGSVHIPVKL